MEDYDCSPEAIAALRNSIHGDLKGYNCELCKNKGWVYTVIDGAVKEKYCKCNETRRTIQLAEKSGLYDLIKVCKFSNFNTDFDFQKALKTSAKRFLADNGQWYYIGGQSGSGKTHICTAIFGELIKKGYPAMYVTWRGEIAKLKRCTLDYEKYNQIMSQYKDVKVLYIDDFLKVKSGYDGAKSVTDADINIAYELLNHRCSKQGAITIISSEFPLDIVVNIDEATGGRIKQKCGGYVITIDKDIDKNYRLTDNPPLPESINGTNPSYDIEELERRGMNIPEL